MPTFYCARRRTIVQFFAQLKINRYCHSVVPRYFTSDRVKIPAFHFYENLARMMQEQKKYQKLLRIYFLRAFSRENKIISYQKQQISVIELQSNSEKLSSLLEMNWY